ncbi:MAG: hypothetical protein HOO86_03745 [Bacteroidales bacterium]|nr:hypothetical protein [Bacteroidales bacterium]
MKTSRFIPVYLMITVGLILFVLSACNKKDGNENPSGLLADSFDHTTAYPAPDKLTFTRENGSTTSDSVFPGQFVILTTDATAAQLTQLVSQNDGTIIAQVPNAGLFLATIDVAGTDAFLAAMYESSYVVDAFPNDIVHAKGYLDQCGRVSVTGDKNSLVQTIDVSADMGCSENILHKDAVGDLAAAGGVSANVNDVTVYNPETPTAGADTYKSMQKILELLNYAYDHNQPIIINISMGGDDYVALDNYWYHKRFCYLLQAVEKQNPHILDNAIILMSGADAKTNETDDFEQLYQNDFGNSPIWEHLYFVESQEGANGCNLGYVDPGTANVVSAPACHIQMPNSVCTRSGNSFSTPFIANLVGQTHELLKNAAIDVSLSVIMSKLWTYQTENNGTLPTVAQLYSICAGNGGFDNKYDGVWSGTFYYTARVPNESDPPTIVNKSFTFNITLVSTASVPGYPQLLSVTSATCSDPAFGATSPIVPVATLSMAFLPAAFGSVSQMGMAINVEFPNGSHISTTNFVDGSFSVDANGRVIASTNLVADEAFSAAGLVENSNEPGSGPGGYAYNWCTFKSWSFVR